MVSARDEQTDGRRARRKRSSGGVEPAAAAEPDQRDDRSTPEESAAESPPEKSADGVRPTTFQGLHVRGRDAARRIRSVAEECDSDEVRRRLRSLARLVERRPGNVEGIKRIETAVVECLETAAGVANARDRWLLDEAVTWAVAWLARSRRTGGSAGLLLERLADETQTGKSRLKVGDTLPARFLLVLARLFADVAICREGGAAAVAALEQEISSLAMPSGTVGLSGSAAMLERINLWAACRELARSLDPAGGVPWSDACERSWAAALGTGLRLLGRRGRVLTGTGRRPSTASSGILAAARSRQEAAGAPADRPLGWWKSVRRTARMIQRGRRSWPEGKLLAANFHDATGGLSILRGAWGRARDPVPGLRVLLDHRAGDPWLEVAVGDRLLVEGPWRWEVVVDGRPRPLAGAWTVSCWETGRRASFIEISASLGDGIRLERHLALLPRDGIVLAADTVVARGPVGDPANRHLGNGASHGDGIHYRGIVPLAEGLEAREVADTRELSVGDATTRGLALPLALNEWQGAGRGRFSANADGLELQQEGFGRVYAPVWLDCDPTRAGGSLTWRQLTVADTRRILPAHQAVGFRIQAGPRQWLVYRALDEARNRTLLGCNVSSEFLLGRVRRSGTVRRLLELE
jgi:hypothetical protein